MIDLNLFYENFQENFCHSWTSLAELGLCLQTPGPWEGSRAICKWDLQPRPQPHSPHDLDQLSSQWEIRTSNVRGLVACIWALVFPFCSCPRLKTLGPGFEFCQPPFQHRLSKNLTDFYLTSTTSTSPAIWVWQNWAKALPRQWQTQSSGACPISPSTSFHVQAVLFLHFQDEPGQFGWDGESPCWWDDCQHCEQVEDFVFISFTYLHKKVENRVLSAQFWIFSLKRNVWHWCRKC